MDTNRESARRVLQELGESQVPNHIITYEEFEAPTPTPSCNTRTALSGSFNEENPVPPKAESGNDESSPSVEDPEDGPITLERVDEVVQTNDNQIHSYEEPQNSFRERLERALSQSSVFSYSWTPSPIQPSTYRTSAAELSRRARAEHRVRVQAWNRRIIRDISREDLTLRDVILLANSTSRISRAISLHKCDNMAPLSNRTCRRILPTPPRFRGQSGIRKVWQYPPGSKGFKRECWAQWKNFQYAPTEQSVYRPMGVGPGWQNWIEKARLFNSYWCRVVKHQPSKLRNAF
jgi:hypothetical protein